MVVLGVGLPAAVVAIAASISAPYYALAPGSVWPTDDRIIISDDAGITVASEEGSIGFTTVSVKPTSLLEYWLGRLDPTVQIVDEEIILGDGTRDENRERNLELMADSKVTAAAVALEELGYDVIQCDAAVITQVIEGSAAEGVVEAGDEVVAVNDTPVTCWEDATEIIGAMAPGETLTLEVRRWADTTTGNRSSEPVGTTETVEATLGERPLYDEETGEVIGSDPDAPFLGVAGETRPTFDFPFSVDISTDDVGGPSAGLALTLSVLEALTPGEVTGGRFIATTGTIDLAGNVGPVGGVAQKAVAADEAGVDLFLVPSGEYEEAVAHAGSMPVIAVDTLDEALEVLADELGGGRSVVTGASAEVAAGG